MYQLMKFRRVLAAGLAATMLMVGSFDVVAKERGNKGGEMRGKDRAEQVKQMNEEKEKMGKGAKKAKKAKKKDK